MEYIKIKENEAKHYIYEFEGKYPVISDKAYVFSTAFLSGDVEVKDYASVWPCVSMRGDVNKIVVGKYSNIQDNCCLHVADDHACIVGDYVTVGHSVTLHACTIEDHCLIGMGATVLDGAVIGAGSIGGAGALVTKNTIIPPNSLVLGSPAKVKKELGEESMKAIHAQAIKYKTEWSEKYGFAPDIDGEKYDGSQIV